jgi:thiol-disulfide isomerase/thioredoxin
MIINRCLQVLAVILSSVLITASADTGVRKAPPRPAHLPAEVRQLAIGDSAPDFALPGIDGRTHRLNDYKDASVLMVIFLSNHCPFCHAIEPRLIRLVEEYRSAGLSVVAINPNHPDAVSVTELGYAKYNDSFEEMKPYAKESRFNFPYLYDGETQGIAKAYGALATPHVFIFDGKRRLRHTGRYDDSRFVDPTTVKFPDARNVVEALLAGRPVPVEITRPMGCSTKWLEKKTLIAEADEKWRHTPVSIELIDSMGVKALAANPTGKLRLFNVWATWCTPCVEEFPELVSLTRRLQARQFEVITISLDDPKHSDRAQRFLADRSAGMPEKLAATVHAEGRKTNNYLYNGADLDDLVSALDPDWPGPLPHSILVAPGGRIVWRQNGPIGFPDLIERIYEFLGTVYEAPTGP